jgi:hypothetical protein
MLLSSRVTRCPVAADAALLAPAQAKHRPGLHHRQALPEEVSNTWCS